VSARQQLRLCLLTLLIFPLTLVPLELQRRIVDGAIARESVNLGYIRVSQSSVIGFAR